MAQKIEFNKNDPLNFAFFENLEGLEKEKRKGEKTLFLLEEMVKEIEAKMKAGEAPGASANPPMQEDAAQDDYEQAMIRAAWMLQMLQLTLAKANNNQAEANFKVAQAQMDKMQAAYQKMLKKIRHMEHEEKKNKLISKISRICEAVLGAVVAAVALAFGQVELAVVVLAMTGLSAGGAFQALSHAFAGALKSMGVPPKVADIVADVAVMVLVIVMTAVICPADAPAIADEGTEGGLELAELGEASAETATEIPATGSRLLEESSNVLQKVNKLNPLSRLLSARTNTILMFALQTLSSTQFTDHIAAFAPKKEREGLMIALTCLLLVLSCMSALAATGAMTATQIGNATEASTGAGQGITMSSKVLQAYQGFMQNANTGMLFGLQSSMLYLDAATAILQMAEGWVTVDLGINTMELAKDNAHVELYQAMLGMATSGSEATQQAFATQIDGLRQTNQHATMDAFAGERALANLIATHSVV